MGHRTITDIRVIIAFLLVILFYTQPAAAQITYDLPHETPVQILTAYQDNVTSYARLNAERSKYNPDSAQYQAATSQMNKLVKENAAINDMLRKYNTQRDINKYDLKADEVDKYQALRNEYLNQRFAQLKEKDPVLAQNMNSSLETLERELDQILKKSDQHTESNDISSELDGLDDFDQTETHQNSGWIFTAFIKDLQNHTYHYVVNVVYEDLAAETHNIFTLMVAVWLIWTVVSFFFLQKQTNAMQIGFQLFMIMLASTVLTTGGATFFVAYFYKPMLGAFYGLADFFMTKATGVSGEGADFSGAIIKLEEFLQSCFSLSAFMADSAPSFFSDAGKFISALFFSAVFSAATAALVFLFAAYWSYSLFALHVLLAITPIMVMLACFNATRGYTFKWFSGVINYLSIPVVLSISMGITLLMFDQYIDDLNNSLKPTVTEGGNKITSEDEQSFWSILIIAMLSFLVHMRVGEISAFLTGGISAGLSSSWALGITAINQTKQFASGATKQGVRGAQGAANYVSNKRAASGALNEIIPEGGN